jgi:hypothetical protein
MTANELKVIFPGIDETNWKKMMDYTAGVPLYAAMFLVTYDGDAERFQHMIYFSVRESLTRLEQDKTKTERYWIDIQTSVFYSLMGRGNSSPFHYDKKFFIESTEEATFYYKPLMPMVLTVCQQYLWNDLMQYISTQENELLGVCRSNSTTNDVRGRLFELMVVQRCVQKGVVFKLGRMKVNIPATQQNLKIVGQLLPKLTSNSENGVYVPINMNFPAIDLVWKFGDKIFGVQVHVSSHPDVAVKFRDMCSEAGWFVEFEQVHLIYLSPEDGVSSLVAALVDSPKQQARRGKRNASALQVNPHIYRKAMTRKSIGCLNDLNWPEGCSIAK